MALDDDGVQDQVDGALRVAVTAGGQVLEHAARARADRQRDEADRLRSQANADDARARALADVDGATPAHRDDVAAIAVLRAGDRHAEADEARSLADRNQAHPPVEAVRTPVAAAPKPRGAKGRAGRTRERDRGR